MYDDTRDQYASRRARARRARSPEPVQPDNDAGYSEPDDDGPDRHRPSPAEHRASKVLHAYLRTVLWSSTDEDGKPLDVEYSTENIDRESIERARTEIVAFLHDNHADLRGMPADQIGHDFALTRDHHGAGFWDRGLGERGDRLTKACDPFGETGAYIGDDGMVHLS